MALGALPGFKSLDNDEVFKEYREAIFNQETKNIVVEFDDNEAYAARNLDRPQLKELLETQRAPGSVTRWINLFGPEKQTKTIALLAEKYDLSSRLHGIMSTSPPPNPPKSSGDKSHKSLGQQRPQSKGVDINHYKLADNVWHFCSTDWSSRCLCIGYNSLSDLIVDEPETSSDDESSRRKFSRKIRGDKRSDKSGGDVKNKPNCRRLWNWLLICEDNTVISIQENPFPYRSAPSEQRDALRSIRRNMANVFRHLSKVDPKNEAKEQALDTLDIRPNCTMQGSTVTIADSAALLFYYLFDDWYTSYNLVATDERYANVLQTLRGKMFERARLSKIKQLHQTGHHLAVLKRIYKSYVLIIDRILSRQQSPGMEQLEGTRAGSGGGAGGTQVSEQGGQAYSTPLTPRASVKFERLRDRIELYALSELDECLEEKESLVFLNFNLMTMRQAEAVEKLTRITILLAKVTILFMPVSLMTGYFSTQIQELQGAYTAQTYWASFAVIVTLSLLFLACFGAISKTLEGGMLYRSITDVSLALPKKAMKAMKGPKEETEKDSRSYI